MTTYQTPDVYIEEIPVFPPSVAEVPTAIPAFIGYTERAKRRVDGDLHNSATEITSMVEYEALFGGAEEEELTVQLTTNALGGGYDAGEIKPTQLRAKGAERYVMWYALRMFFDNGGGRCYVVSVGTYANDKAQDVDGKDVLVLTALEGGLATIEAENEPTLIVIPDAVKLPAGEYKTLITKALDQCGKLKDRFGIFDVYEGAQTLDENARTKNRGYLTVTNPIDLKYGSAYYPFLRTNLNYDYADAGIKVVIDKAQPVLLSSLADANTAQYNAAKAALRTFYITMPPSAAVAGAYATTDRARGVWKSPANVGLLDVIEPVVKITNEGQSTLNVDSATGKSINVIRAFPGKGSLIWGARTLAGNDNEWRYVSVRRFFNMVEESIKNSTYWAVFEANNANTWVKVRGMISNYLIDKWRDGALAGAKPDDAFFVKCGLGTTMTSQDVLQGIMNVEVGIAVVRPAEFIVLKFFHKLQTS